MQAPTGWGQNLIKTIYSETFFFIVLGFNVTPTLVGHFVSSPRQRDRRDSKRDEREEEGRKRNKNESEETEEIKAFPTNLTCYKDKRPCSTVSQYVRPPVRYTTPSHHLTTHCYSETILIKFHNVISQKAKQHLS